MKKILCFLYKCLQCPLAVFSFILVTSITALSAALLSEIFLGLEPCELCIHQRWGFFWAATFAVIGLIFKARKPIPSIMAVLSGLSFLITGGIAVYHTGVEQKWWISAVEGCSVPSSFIDGDQNWIDNIMSAPSAPCDIIPWQDPIIGLSMANYNILLCAGMFVICMTAALRFKKANISP
ncbi:MAG: disulfide bond formation protein B [Micavibrio sp.]|nr:disulfide bond formation protein B [Micavibrio sp.]|tara:strand:+ start:1429 stop:1968 length:540 start_codon:yes stop_codon:yes gene_type:complete